MIATRIKKDKRTDQRKQMNGSAVKRWHRGAKWICLAIYAVSASGAVSQTPMQQAQGARVQQLPLSTRDQGDNISAQKHAGARTGISISTIESAVNISGRYQGSVTDPSGGTSDLLLSFNDAIQRGLRFNLGGVTAGNTRAQARNQRLAALSQLLPSLNGVLSETVARRYLPADGISSATFGGGGGFKVPSTTGQFHYYTLQGSVTEDALDLTAIHNLRGSEASNRATQLNVKDARELVVLGVGGTYIQMITAAAIVTRSGEVAARYVSGAEGIARLRLHKETANVTVWQMRFKDVSTVAYDDRAP